MTADDFTTLERQEMANLKYGWARLTYGAGQYPSAVDYQRSAAWWSSLARGEMDAWIIANHPEWCNTP